MLSNSPSTSRLHPLASRARKAYDFNIVDSYVIRFRSDDQVYRRSPFCETVEYVYKMSRLFFPGLSNTPGRCTAFNETLIKFLSPQIFVIKYSALEGNSARDIQLISCVMLTAERYCESLLIAIKISYYPILGRGRGLGERAIRDR